jgi:hypothetical protein
MPHWGNVTNQDVQIKYCILQTSGELRDWHAVILSAEAAESERCRRRRSRHSEHKPGRPAGFYNGDLMVYRTAWRNLVYSLR